MLKLLKYLEPYKRYAIFTVFLVLLHNVTTLVLPLMMSDIINNGITKNDQDYIIRTGVIMLCISAAGMIISVASSYCSSKVSSGYSAILRQEVFLKIESFSQSDIDKIGVSSLITRTTNDIRQVQDMVLTMLKSLITVPILLIGGSIMAVIMDPGLSVIILVIAPVIAIIALIAAKKVIPMFDEIQKKTDKLNQVIRENLNGIRVTRAFNRTEYEAGRFSSSNIELTGLALRINRIMAGLIPIATLLVFMIIIALVMIGSEQINSLDAVLERTEIENTIGDLQAFILYLVFIVLALSTAAALFIMIPRAKISADRILEVLETEPEIKSAPEEKDTGDSTVRGLLEFKNVSFGYREGEELRNVLSDLSFTCGAGEVTAIIGGTGSGKSTVINLIPRFYDVTSGAVVMDGTDIREMSFSALHSKIAFIPQQTLLFSGTVADNLRYGKEDATDEELWRALDIAQASEFVEKLPDGIESLVSQNGINLSGGQKQRLAIARAIVKNAEFYIFDDSFSALDYATDARLRAALHENLADANIIIVAQRVGTIMNADRIILLDEGKISAVGTHAELLQGSELYREIVDSQLQKEEAEEVNGGE